MKKIGGYENIETGTPKEIAEAEVLLEKNGISGPNRCEKVGMIGKSIALCVTEQEMANMDEESLAMMKNLGMDPLAKIRITVNETDYKIVKNTEIQIVWCAPFLIQSNLPAPRFCPV